MSKKILRSLLLFLFVLNLSVGTVSGMTIGEERDIGEKLLYKIRSEFSLFDDPDISQYINTLGQKVLAEVSNKYFDYHFFVVPSDQFNAFAAPSGLIFFYTGLIEKMKTEDELLSVMAHEIAHVESRHIASQTGKNTKVGAISMALAMASLALGDPSLAAGLFTGFQAAGLAANLHFSRVDEQQSDKLAYDWMHAMHRDPRSMEEMLKTMRRITRYRSEKVPPYLLTHPNPEARLEYIQSLLDYQAAKVPRGFYVKTDNFDFLRMKYRVMVSVGNPLKIRAYLTNSIETEQDPERQMMATYGMALLQAKELDFTKALANLAKVQQHFPGRSILDVDAGIMYLGAGEPEKSIELLVKAVEKNPDDMYASFHLGLAYAKQGRGEDAERLFKKVIAVMPEYPKAYFELARIKSKQGNSGLSNYYLAKSYLYDGKMELARNHFQKVRNDDSVEETTRNNAEQMLQRLDKLERL